MNKRYKQEYGRRFKKVNLWNIGPYLAKEILDGLKMFRRLKKHSIPPFNPETGLIVPNYTGIKSNEVIFEPDTDENKEILDKYNQIIDKMIFSFEEIVNENKNNPFYLARDKYFDNIESFGKTLTEEEKKEFEKFKKKKNDDSDGMFIWPSILEEFIEYHVPRFREEYGEIPQYEDMKKEVEEYTNKVNEGLKLFIMYLPHLWD